MQRIVKLLKFLAILGLSTFGASVQFVHAQDECHDLYVPVLSDFKPAKNDRGIDGANTPIACGIVKASHDLSKKFYQAFHQMRNGEPACEPGCKIQYYYGTYGYRGKDTRLSRDIEDYEADESRRLSIWGEVMTTMYFGHRDIVLEEFSLKDMSVGYSKKCDKSKMIGGWVTKLFTSQTYAVENMKAEILEDAKRQGEKFCKEVDRDCVLSEVGEPEIGDLELTPDFFGGGVKARATYQTIVDCGERAKDAKDEDWQVSGLLNLYARCVKDENFLCGDGSLDEGEGCEAGVEGSCEESRVGKPPAGEQWTCEPATCTCVSRPELHPKPRPGTFERTPLEWVSRGGESDALSSNE